MEQKDFREILNRYQSGRASEHEIQMVEKWYKKMGEQPVSPVGAEEEILEEQYLVTITGRVGKGAPQKQKSKAKVVIRKSNSKLITSLL